MTTTAASPAAPTRSDHHATVGRYLTFTLQGEVYALDIMQITEIIGFRALTVVPMMPSYIRGVVNLRGRVLPVVDLAERFGQGGTEVARRTSILVVEGARIVPDALPQALREVLAEVLPGPGDADAPAEGSTLPAVGLMVDSVTKVVHLDDEQIAPPPAFGAGVRAEFISGMARLDGDFAVILDVGRLLTTPIAS